METETGEISYEEQTEYRYGNEDLFLRPYLLSDREGYVKLRDEALNYVYGKKKIDYEVYLGEKIPNYYAIYCTKMKLAYIKIQSGPSNRLKKEIIKLSERQIYDFNRSAAILYKYGKTLNVSPTGAGKTFISTALSLMFDSEYLFVIGAKSIQGAWNKMNSYYKPKIQFYSIKTFGRTFKLTENNKFPTLLIEKIDKLPYLTQKFKDFLINNKCFIIFDEIDSGKNKGYTSNCYNAITRFIDEHKTQANIMYLSATPTDKNNTTQVYYNLGIIRNDAITVKGFKAQDDPDKDYFINIYNFLCSKEYNNVCNKIINSLYTGKNKYENKITKNIDEYTKDEADIFLKFAYSKIVSKHLTSFTPTTFSKYVRNIIPPEFKPDVSMRLYKLKPNSINNEIASYDDILQLISSIILHKVIIGSSYNESVINLIIFNYIVKLSYIMNLPNVIGLAREKLAKDRNCKVVIFMPVMEVKLGNEKEDGVSIFTYQLNIMDTVKEALNDYSLEIITGKTPTEQRDRIRNSFNEDNNDLRILITTPAVSAKGVDLHDRSEGGRHKRYAIVMTDFNATISKQILGRFYRIGVTSKAEIIFPIAVGNISCGENAGTQEYYDNISTFTYKHKISKFEYKLIGKKEIYNSHLNYIVPMNREQKSLNIENFSSDSLNVALHKIPVYLICKPLYSLDSYSNKIIKEIINILKGVLKRAKEENARRDKEEAEKERKKNK